MNESINQIFHFSFRTHFAFHVSTQPTTTHEKLGSDFYQSHSEMSSTNEAKESSAGQNAADMTRRMVCGGLAGMIAKVSLLVY